MAVNMALCLALSFAACLLLPSYAVVLPSAHGMLKTPKDIHSHIGDLRQKILSQKMAHFANTLDKNIPTEELGKLYAQRIVGTFVTACESYDCLVVNTGGTIPCSALGVERIDSGQNVLTDVTFYVRDYNCRPNSTDVLAKIVLHSHIEFAGNNNKFPGAFNIYYEPRTSSFSFNYQSNTAGLIPGLNQYCPCKGRWASGVNRTINPGDCNASMVTRDSDVYELCSLVVGKTVYITAQWVGGTFQAYYQNEGAFTSVEGWQQPLNRSLINYRLPESGVTNRTYCNFNNYDQCIPPIKVAAKACTSCFGLECEACIWQEYPASLNKEEEYSNCCPCLYWYADEYNVPFLKVNC
eukprot:m.44338 g.44338  ORF g.44338 m.44338 type:complete len:352 (-) comp10083_c0_seq3:52-1107(-)